MPARIYAIGPSHPARACIAMLRHKRIPHRVVWLMPGLHPMLVRLAGFERHTVPALDLDGRAVQGSSEIARHLDEVTPDPPLFPADAAARAAVEEAERWGHRRRAAERGRLSDPVGRPRAARVRGARAPARGPALRGARPVALPHLDRAVPERPAPGQLSDGSAGIVAISR
jgi:glutathione S-transferase